MPKASGIKITLDLEATSVEKKIYIYMVHFHPPLDWTQWGKPWPLITPQESKISGVMMSQGKNRLNLV